MSNNQIRTLYNELRDIKRVFEDLGQRIDQLERAFAAVLGDDPPAAPAPVDSTAPALTPTAVPVEKSYTAPLVFLGEGSGKNTEELYPNGIDGVYGQPLLRINAAVVAALAQGEGVDDDLKQLHEAKIKTYDPSKSQESPLDVAVRAKKEALKGQEEGHLGTVIGVDQNKIAEARWAAVVHAQEDVAILQALWPLIQHRMRQMGFSTLDFNFQSSDATCGDWINRHTDGFTRTLKDNWGEVPPVLLVRPGERITDWLTRYGVSQAPVDPTLGVPFYLMLVARPGPLTPTDQAFIPLNFQYELDMFWGVGRLIFSDADGRHRLDAYQAYAEQVVAWESRPDAAARLRKEIAFFGTRHEDDNSTRRSADELVSPLIAWSKTSKLTTAKGIGQSVYLGDDATRSNLEHVLSASTPPALLFTASHGIGLPISDPARLVLNQGALVTADFEFGKIKREHWLAGEDLDGMANANLEGMIAFLFACYSAGCPQQDEFIFDTNKQRPIIAPFPFIAQLPQRMLAKGALAVLGHVERAWTFSFTGTEASSTSQIQPFQDVLGRLLQGMPAGSATDQFNVIQGARSLTLTQEIEENTLGAKIDPQRLSRLWMSRNDARNYVLLGDPAVRLAL
jgi:Peptidase family C25